MMESTEAPAKIDVGDIFKKLTGWDEIAIEQRFGVALADVERKPTTAVRIAVFVDLKRHGKSDSDAHQAAMDMPLDDLMELVDMASVEAGDERDPFVQPSSATP